MFERRFFRSLSLVFFITDVVDFDFLCFFDMQYNVVKRLPAAASTFSRSKYVINETKQMKHRSQKRSSETKRVNECDDREWIKKWCHLFDFCFHLIIQYGKWHRCQTTTQRWFKWVVVASSFAIENWRNRKGRNRNEIGKLTEREAWQSANFCSEYLIHGKE